MKPRMIALALVLFSAEIVASWWVWGRTPTDTIRVWYSGFWPFEAGRLHYWLPVFAAVLAIWIMVWYALLRHGRPLTQWLFTAVTGVVLEVVTSVLYWRSPQSSDMRGLYQTVWRWHRVPQANERGWPSFRIYLWDHIVPWAVVFLLGMTLWIFIEHRAKGATRAAPPGAGASE
jgi:hypothetical protein